MYLQCSYIYHGAFSRDSSDDNMAMKKKNDVEMVSPSHDAKLAHDDKLDYSYQHRPKSEVMFSDSDGDCDVTPRVRQRSVHYDPSTMDVFDSTSSADSTDSDQDVIYR